MHATTSNLDQAVSAVCRATENTFHSPDLSDHLWWNLEISLEWWTERNCYGGFKQITFGRCLSFRFLRCCFRAREASPSSTTRRFTMRENSSCLHTPALSLPTCSHQAHAAVLAHRLHSLIGSPSASKLQQCMA